MTSDGEKLIVKGEDTLVKRPITIPFDLVVHAIGMDPNLDNAQISSLFGVDLEPNGFLDQGQQLFGHGPDQPERCIHRGARLPGRKPSTIRSPRARLQPWPRLSSANWRRGWWVRQELSAWYLYPRFLQSRSKGELARPQLQRPQLELSGPILKQAFETLVSGAESQGGVEYWIDALKLKQQMFQQALGQGHPADLPLDTFKSLCAFMVSVRRRVGLYLENPAYGEMVEAIVELLSDYQDTSATDERLAAFCARFPQDKKHRWVRDLAAEILHGVDPERYPLMGRWIWDRKANTGVIREIWFDDDIDNITLNVPDGFGTHIMLREELASS